jgi:hypothetical protein
MQWSGKKIERKGFKIGEILIIQKVKRYKNKKSMTKKELKKLFLKIMK